MKPEEINALISILPNIFDYIAPGYIFFRSFNFVLDWQEKTFKNNIFEYIIMSYVLYSVQKFILGLFYTEVMMNLPQVIFTLIIMSIISGYLLGIFIKSKKFKNLREFLGVKRSINNNIFNDVIDKIDGTWARVYLKNEKVVYYGAVVLFDKKDKYEDGVIVLNQYYVYKYGTSEVLDATLPSEEKRNYFVTIKINEVSRIETIYQENSEFINDLLGREETEVVSDDIVEETSITR